MLVNLHIKNMALIDEIDIDFNEGLNIMTGETGAGKSIVIDSIMTALGSKMPKDFVRKDAEYGLVELLFSVEDEDTLDALKELEISGLEEGEIVLSRKIMGGRSVCKANGETVTIGRLKEIAALLLDLHAQHENQSLLVERNHLTLLDRYGKDELETLKEKVASEYKNYSDIKKELSETDIGGEEKARQLDLLSYEIREIEDAKLIPAEDEKLEEEYKLASNSKEITEALSLAASTIEMSLSDSVDRSLREMSKISSYDERLSDMNDALATASDVLSDFVRSSKDYIDENNYSEEEFFAMEKRLDLINHLKSKYGKTIEDINSYHDEAVAKYERLTSQDEYINELKGKLSKVSTSLEKLCDELTEQRKKVSVRLTAQIREALMDLNFPDVRFDMVFEKTEDYKLDGRDNAYFIISANVGEDMKKLSEVASGGELSRIMLALKSCLAKEDNIETLIFDEIDVGISGRTAQKVAEKIAAIGKSHQVICITHLPQIAAMAKHHYLISKTVEGEKTVTRIDALDENEQITELARMLGGVKITDAVIKNAKEMKALAMKS